MSTVDGRTLQNTELGSMLNTAAPTPEPFGSMADDGFYSKITMTLYNMKNRHMIYYNNHNYNKILNSDWLSTVLISALTFYRTVYYVDSTCHACNGQYAPSHVHTVNGFFLIA